MSSYVSALINRTSNSHTLYYSDQKDLWKYLTVFLSTAVQDGHPVCIHAKDEMYSWLGNKVQNLKTDTISSYYNSLTHLGIEEVIQTGRLLSTKCLGRWTVADIIDLLTQYRDDIDPYPFHAVPSFVYSADEFYNLVKAIDKFKAYQQYYQQEGLRAKDISKYRKEVIFNLGNEEFKKKIKAWISEIKEIILQFHTGLNEEKALNANEAFKKVQHTIQQWESKLERLDLLFNTYGEDILTKPNLLSFDSKRKEGYKKWIKFISDQTNETASNWKYDDWVRYFKKEINKAKSAYTEEKEQIQLSLKSVNELTTENENLLRASKQLETLIQSINQSLIYQRAFECNTHSIHQKIKIALDIKEELELSLQHTNIKAAIEWSETRNNLDPSFISFLSQLKQLPQGHWRVQFEYFYLNSFLDRNNIELHNTSSEQMIDYKTISNFLYEACLRHLQSMVANMPECITLSNQEYIKEGSYNIYIDLNFPENSDLLALQFNEETGPMHIFSVIDELTPVKHIQPSQQLAKVKKLAYNLFPFINQAVGYQTKESNIISALDHHWKDLLDKRITECGGKPFILDEADDLINFMLSVQRTTYLIVQDYLLCTSSYEDLFQYEAIHYLKQSGIEIINLSSLEILADEETAIKKVLNQLPLKQKNEVNLSQSHGIEH